MTSSPLRVALTGLLLAAAVLAAFAVQVWYFKPLKLDWFFSRVSVRLALADPEQVSALHALEPLGLTFQSDDLTDVSPQQQLRLAAQARRCLETLRRYDRSKLDAAQRQNYDALAAALEVQVRGEPWLLYDMPVNPLDGVQLRLPRFMLGVHAIGDPEDVRNYIVRLGKFGEKFDQVIAGLALREERQILPPRFVVDTALAQMRAFIAPAPAENILYTDLARRLGALADVPDSLRTALLEDAQHEIAESVYPAYKRLIAHLEHLRGRVSEDRGVWALPMGDQYYAWLIRHYGGASEDPDALHEFGLEEVKRIEARMRVILDAQGKGSGTVGERMMRLATMPRFSHERGAAGLQQQLADFRRLIDQADRALLPWFEMRPQSEIVVTDQLPYGVPLHADLAYAPAPLDGSAPAQLYVNPEAGEALPKFAMRTRVHQEVFPGRHLQESTAREQALPLFRRLLPTPAYTLGWAVYAERFAQEANVIDDAYESLGQLQQELMRTVRLVVDTGLHRKRWKREEAVAYMRGITGISEPAARAEVEHALIRPGEALAGPLGAQRLLDLRKRAQRALGPGFDIRAFHQMILGGGPMPLDALQLRVDDWISAQRGG